jgi:hypothetical protein
MRGSTPALALFLLWQVSLPASAERVVRGLDGQADLVLDPGRSLHGHPLDGPRSPVRLSAIEKARLDARRIAAAPRLTRAGQLRRLVAVARHRLPVPPDVEARYQRSVQRQLHREGQTRLSTHVADRAGLCRERAFLLRSLLREAHRPALVRYGVVYDDAGAFLGGHAWVETRERGQRLLLEPSLPPAMGQVFPISGSPSKRSARRVSIVEQVDGKPRHVRGTVLPSGVLYLPTDDLRYR